MLYRGPVSPFPILLSLAWFLGRFKIAFLLVASVVVSLAIAEWGWRNSSIANFFLTPTRIWELSVGALIALAPIDNIRKFVGTGICKSASLVSLLVLISTLVMFKETTPHPSLVTLLPVAATAGIIFFCDGSGVAGAILSNRIMVGIGLLSYSLYLWHQPIFVFTRLYSPVSPSLFVFGLLSFVSLGIAYLSWRFWAKS